MRMRTTRRTIWWRHDLNGTVPRDSKQGEFTTKRAEQLPPEPDFLPRRPQGSLWPQPRVFWFIRFKCTYHRIFPGTLFLLSLRWEYSLVSLTPNPRSGWQLIAWGVSPRYTGSFHIESAKRMAERDTVPSASRILACNAWSSWGLRPRLMTTAPTELKIMQDRKNGPSHAIPWNASKNSSEWRPHHIGIRTLNPDEPVFLPRMTLITRMWCVVERVLAGFYYELEPQSLYV